MKLTRTLGVALVLAAASACVHARHDVHWSIGIQPAPGLVVGYGNVRPVYVAPPPVYYVAPPVYYAPPPVYYAPAPIYYAPPPVVYFRPRQQHYFYR